MKSIKMTLPIAKIIAKRLNQLGIPFYWEYTNGQFRGLRMPLEYAEKTADYLKSR